MCVSTGELRRYLLEFMLASIIIISPSISFTLQTFRFLTCLLLLFSWEKKNNRLPRCKCSVNCIIFFFSPPFVLIHHYYISENADALFWWIWIDCRFLNVDFLAVWSVAMFSRLTRNVGCFIMDILLAFLILVDYLRPKTGQIHDDQFDQVHEGAASLCDVSWIKETRGGNARRRMVEEFNSTGSGEQI